MIPIFILQTWLLGLFSLGIIGGALYLVHEWQQRSWRWDPVLEQSFFAPNFGLNEETMLLAIALILMLRVRGRHNRQSDPAPDKIQNGRDGRRPAQNAESGVAAASA